MPFVPHIVRNRALSHHRQKKKETREMLTIEFIWSVRVCICETDIICHRFSMFIKMRRTRNVEVLRMKKELRRNVNENYH